jgi:Fanconi anemia group J protein
MSNGNFEKLIGKYRQSISRLVADPQSMGKRTGCVFFAVFRGKVSEGLDFVDENARAVISIGIPYPALKDEKIVLKREFNDQTRGSVLNGSNWYEKQAFRAINQALGRCIRHRDDWGAIILLESRFQQQRCLDQLSKWIRPSIRQVRDFYLGLAELKAFIDGKYPRGLLAMSKPTLDPSDSDKGDSDTEGHAPVWKT